MRQLVYLRRDGEGVARWAVIAVMLAVIALVAASLSFPAEAAAQTTSTPASTTTSPSTPATPAEGPDAGQATSTTSTTAGSTAARATTSAAPAARTTAPSRDETTSATTTGEGRTQSRRVEPRDAQLLAINPAIEVGITKIVVEDKGTDTQIKVGDNVEVHGTWDATDANPQAGDQFTIGFPAELKLTETTNFDLVGGGESWGSCSVDVASNVMTCTLSDAVTANPELVKGDFFVFSKAVRYTTAETVDFLISGQTTVQGRLPGDGGITDGAQIGSAKKSGKFTPDKAAITWTIDIPGSDLIALDTDGTGKVTLTDTLSDNMTLCEDRLNASLAAGRPSSLTPVPNGVSVTQTGPGTPVTIDITNGQSFKADQLYRVKYTSCTTSGEVDLPADGGESVQYTNTVEIGDASVGTGIGQDWRPSTDVNKSGTINSGARFGRLDWTVTIPGTFIAQKNHNVVIDEQLSANHEICDEGGLGLKVVRQDYLPGPGGGSAPTTDVTGQFNITPTGTATGSRTFSIALTPKDVGSFDPEKYYLVKFATCVTGEQVPDESNIFTNTATVNGLEKTADVTGPTFVGTKTGTINFAPKVVNGEEHPAGTTVDWGLQVPGRDLEGLGDKAVVTDTFSETLAVCDAGGDLKNNLNLRVLAKDFQSNGPVETRDLTAETDVDASGNVLTFTLPKQAGDYSREVRYFIDYTLCTASGGLDKRGTVYSNTAAWEGKSTSQEVRQTSGGGGTGQGATRGSFSLEKTVAPGSKDFPFDDTEFTVRVEEFAPGVDPANGNAESTYKVKVKADGTPVSGLNARGSGWKIRLTEIELPSGDGVFFEPGTFRPGTGIELNENRTQAIVTIQPRTNVAVELRNKAQNGTATITKKVVGDAASDLTGAERFVIEASIDRGVEGSGTEQRQFTLRDGQFYDLGDLPIGTTVTFSEVLPANTDSITWSEPVFEPESLVIGTNPAGNSVTVTNTANRTEGSFEIRKELRGPEANSAAVPESFDVVASWTDSEGEPRSKTLQLPADGSPISFGEKLPGGTEVTLVETVPANGSGLSWGAPSYSGDVTLDESGAAVVTVGRNPGSVAVRNYVDTNSGTLSLLKQVSGEAADDVTDQQFTVEARWRDGTRFRTEELTVTAGEATPLGFALPVGTEVTFTETGLPEIAGVDWGTISWDTNPTGDSWLVTNPDGTATGIVSDDPTAGRIITLTNEANRADGSVGFEKFVFDGEDPIPATDADLPSGASFQVRIDGIDPALPAGTDFPAVGETVTLNSGNDWSWQSGDVLPQGTVITFSEVDPAPLDGVDWARPFYYVAADAGEPGDRDTVEIVGADNAEVQIRNRPVPTGDVVIDKVVSGVKGGQVAKHSSTTFQVTATWTDPDDEGRSCVLDVRPDGTMTPTVECDAVVIGDRVQFPLDTEITFVETGARTDVTNVKWGEVIWSVQDGEAGVESIDGEPAGAVVTLTGDDPVTLGLENKTSSNGLIILPFPLPIPGFGCNCGDTGSLGSGSASGSLDSGSLGSGSGSDSGSGSGSGSLGSLGLGSLGLGSLGLGSLGSGSNGSGSLPGSSGTGSLPGSTGTGSNSGSAGSNDQGSNGSGSNGSGSNGGSSMGSLDSASLGIGAGSAAAGSAAGSAGSTALGSAGSTAAGSLGLPGSVAAGSLGTIILGSLGSSDGSADGSTGDGSLNGGSDGSGDGSLGSGSDQDAPGSGSPSGPDEAAGPGGGGNPDQPVSPEGASNAGATPVEPMKPSAVAGTSGQGHDGAPGRPAPAKPQSPQSLAVTGTDVAWLGGAALALLAGGAWLVLRSRRDPGIEE